MLRRLWHRLLDALRRDFVAGLLVIVPVGFTVLGVIWILDQLDRLVLPRVFGAVGFEAAQPPFVGVLATLALILLAGALTRSFVGRGVLRLWERLVDQIPVARSLYTVLKQFMEAVFVSGGSQRNFSKVVLIEYPRLGLWSYAFVTGGRARTPEGAPRRMLTVFVPSTPNPTTGYFLVLPEEDAIDTGLGVEEAFKMIVSAGISQPAVEAMLDGAQGAVQIAEGAAGDGSPTP